MVRTVKTKAARSLKKGERALLLPGATGAEPWELWLTGKQGPAECIRTFATPLENRHQKGATLALPVGQVFCLPLWLNETEPKNFAGMIPLQLELHGLQPRGQSPVFDWALVAKEETRSLVLVGVLPATLPAELSVEAYSLFDLSARLYPLPEDALTIWMEQDRLVFAFTRGTNLAYFQALTEARISERVIQDITCAWAILGMQGMLPELKEVMLWTEISPPELLALQTALNLPIKHAPRPAPRDATSAWKLTPSTVDEARRTKEMQKWRTRGIILGGIVYLCVVAFLLGRIYLTSQKVEALKKWQADHVEAVSLVQSTEASWRDLRPVVDERNYPLELLLHTCDSMPADQMHLTLFEAGDGHVLIKGEAKNFGAASQFQEKVKHDDHLNGYTWDFGSPRLLPNDLTQLQIEGTRAN